MKVKELMKKLELEDPESEVILQKDAEGNGYSPLYGVDGYCVYEPYNSWSGDVFSLNWSADDAMKTESEWSEIHAKPRCVVLHPTH